MLRVLKVRLDCERLPEGETKRTLLRAIARSGKSLPFNVVLRITRLSASRYHGWCRVEAGCDLDDQPSCPRVVPTRLTPDEIENMRQIGIRAKAPGELLHLDVTIIRLLDGTRAYLHAMTGNYSRRILSWTLEEKLGSGGTCRI